MRASDYRSFLRLMWLGIPCMATVAVVGVVTGQWTVAAAGVFSLCMLAFSSQQIFRPMRMLKRLGVPMDFFYEAQQLRKNGGINLESASNPKALLVAHRIGRSDSFIRVVRMSMTPAGRFQDADIEQAFKEGLAWLDGGDYDLVEVATLGVAYFDAIVSTAQKEVDFSNAASDIEGYANLARSGTDAQAAVAYMEAVGPVAALLYLRDGVPLEYAQAVEGSDD